MTPRRLVGDEGEYVKKGKLNDPFNPTPFIRVPLLASLSMLAHRHTAQPVIWLRRIMALAGVLAILLTAVAAWFIGGWPAAWLAATVILFVPERLILSCHLWPDGLLLLWIAALSLLLAIPQLPPSLWLALAFGAFACLAFLTRLDGLVLWPALTLVWLLRYGLGHWGELLAIGLPSVCAWVLLSMINGRKHGIFLPDTTMFFNLMLLGRESKRTSFDHQGLDRFISATKGDWDQLELAGRRRDALQSTAHLLLRPWRTLFGVLDRLLAFVGPDTFVREKLFSPAKGGYPELSQAAKRLWSICLFLTFPLLTALVLLLWLGADSLPDYMWPSVAMAFAGFLFHTRTRYRISVLPGLVLALAHAVTARSWQNEWPLAIQIILWLAIPALLLLVPRRGEITQPSQSI